MWYIPRRADGWRGRGRLYSSMTGHKQEAKAAANWGQSARKKKSNDKKHKDAAEDSRRIPATAHAIVLEKSVHVLRKAARPERRASREPEVAYAYMKVFVYTHVALGLEAPGRQPCSCRSMSSPLNPASVAPRSTTSLLVQAGQDWHSGIKKYVSRTDHFKDHAPYVPSRMT